MGVYVFDDGSQIEVMVVAIGGAPASPAATDWDDEGHPLASAYDWLGSWWGEAVAVAAPLFDVNAHAITRGAGQEAVVRRPRLRPRPVVVSDPSRRTDGDRRRTRSPTAGDRRRPVRVDRALRGTGRRLAATITRAKLSEDLTDTSTRSGRSRTIFRPYQFRPILRLLAAGSCACSSPTRSVSARRSRPGWSGPNSTLVGRPTES